MNDKITVNYLSTKIVLCPYCGKPEYWESMTWLNGKCMCRDCYKDEYISYYGNKYPSLTGDEYSKPRPSMTDYENYISNVDPNLILTINKGDK